MNKKIIIVFIVGLVIGICASWLSTYGVVTASNNKYKEAVKTIEVFHAQKEVEVE